MFGQPSAFFLATILAVALCQPVFGQDRGHSSQAVITTVVAPWLEKFAPPGLIVVVHHQGKTEFFPQGHANQARQVPVTPESIFELASITKVFTTTSLAIEVERGQMHLKDPVDKYLPVLQTGTDIRRVTLEQLATHTSSLPRVPGAKPRDQWNRQQVMQWLINWHAPHPPGTKSLYSNLAVGVLGEAIATHEQKPLQEVWEKQFLQPLEMSSTFFEIPDRALANFVQGYDRNGRPVNRASQPGGWPAGGRLCSSGRDMARFLIANLGEDPKHPLITKAIHLAQQPCFKASERMTQGLAWQRIHLNQNLVIDKNGGLAGTSTYIGMMHEKHLGVVVMANRGKVDATGLGRHLLTRLAGSNHASEPFSGTEDDEEE